MSIPKPPVDLDGHCSVIHDNTLYIYTPKAFLSLPLKRNAKWSKLKMGESVTGAACVKGGVDGNPNNPALFVVGGKGGSEQYRGIQRYSFQDKNWQPIEPPTWDIKNRVKHAAIYLRSSSSLLVYAGTQSDDSNPSTQTFLISAAPPFNSQSFDSYVPPAVDPLLLPWGEDKAAMLGGGPGNTQVFTFSAAEGWLDTGTTLAQPLPDKSKVKGAMVNGNDGSRVFEAFDVSVSPNTVTRYVLLGAGGAAVKAGEQIGISINEPPSKRQKRELVLSDYPTYDDKYAPTVVRAQSSLAQDGNGMVVISGGSANNWIGLFDQSKNSWLNETELFVGKNQKVAVSSTTSATSTTATATSTTTSISSVSASASASSAATSSAASPVSGSNPNSKTLTIVGATLGAILGLLALLIIILLLLGWKKRRNKYGSGSRAYPHDKDRLSFQDQGMEPLTLSVQPMGRGPVPSTDSWAMMSRSANDSLSRPSPAASGPVGLGGIQKGPSPLYNVETNKPNIHSRSLAASGLTVVVDSSDDQSRGDRRTDEGWSKYFQDEQDPQILRGNSARSTMSSQYTKSDYRGSGWPHESAQVAPLDLSKLDNPQPLGRVTTGSPSTENPPKIGDTLIYHQGLTAKISSGDSISICSDDNDDHRDAYSSGVPASINSPTHWSSTGHHQVDRVPSSNYSGSAYPSLYEPKNFPPIADGERPMTQWPDDTSGQAPSGRSRAGTNISSDVSWLNLGNNPR
ncbi:hypothetical protein AJ80_03416 [Polytolypa hystricis UAMH7299]|uniref:Pre-mRNA splicing factor CLF1 n=1 Tax=Polytolypa hystricis (strain UAMH7299) TaxID=1447883 RepID=A0A2B7YI60_POLH7|nr:hypothetical protein AJ80_03416 [Polytolypa hystricis UAMH7299]